MLPWKPFLFSAVNEVCFTFGRCKGVCFLFFMNRLRHVAVQFLLHAVFLRISIGGIDSSVTSLGHLSRRSVCEAHMLSCSIG
jgi:hypothetical protein